MLDWLVSIRTPLRGLGLPLYVWPMLPAAILAALAGNNRIVMGAAFALGFTALATRALRRGRRGDTRRAAVLMGVGTGLAAHFAAGLGTILPVMLGFGAAWGTRLAFDALPEAAPPPPPPPPPAPPGPLDEARARLARILAHAGRRADPVLTAVAEAMGGVLDELDRRPERLPMARRFLNVQLDGLERITQRLEAGADPPATLSTLLQDLTTAATQLRASILREESEALEIQVKVLSDRLKQEGPAS
jgi:hypothetical protein